MHKAYVHNAIKNLELYHEISKVLAALQDNAIPVIVLKGAALAALVYPNIALRPMRDVDLLIRDDDIWSVDKIILQLGYENIRIPVSKIRAIWGRHMKYSNGTISVDVHPRICEVHNFDPWETPLRHK